jgi:hypothetical protein
MRNRSRWEYLALQSGNQDKTLPPFYHETHNGYEEKEEG